MTGHWILDDNDIPVEVDDLMAWVRWFGRHDEQRRVAFTELAEGVHVSTVFLGLDHDFSGRGPPLLFESMAFTDYGGDLCERYATRSEAMLGHNHMVEAIRERMREDKSRAVAEDVAQATGMEIHLFRKPPK